MAEIEGEAPLYINIVAMLAAQMALGQWLGPAMPSPNRSSYVQPHCSASKSAGNILTRGLKRRSGM